MSPILIGVVAYLFASAVALVFMMGMGRAAKRGDEVEDQFLAQLELSDNRPDPVGARSPARPTPPARPRPDSPDASRSADRRRRERRIARPHTVH